MYYDRLHHLEHTLLLFFHNLVTLIIRRISLHSWVEGKWVPSKIPASDALASISVVCLNQTIIPFVASLLALDHLSSYFLICPHALYGSRDVG